MSDLALRLMPHEAHPSRPFCAPALWLWHRLSTSHRCPTSIPSALDRPFRAVWSTHLPLSVLPVGLALFRAEQVDHASLSMVGAAVLALASFSSWPRGLVRERSLCWLTLESHINNEHFTGKVILCRSLTVPLLGSVPSRCRCFTLPALFAWFLWLFVVSCHTGWASTSIDNLWRLFHLCILPGNSS